MDEYGERRVRAKRSYEVDWLSNLPEPLIFEVLLKLHTKDVVRTSVLSSRWKNLWRYVPGLDLKLCDFPEYDAFVSFVDKFLNLNSESYLQSFILRYEDFEDDLPETVNILRWINIVVERKVQHLHVLDFWCMDKVELPRILYTCESLVSLKLDGRLVLNSPKFVSLPCLKVLDLIGVQFADDRAMETLISRLPVLESLYIDRSLADTTEVLRICSQSLLNFTYVADNFYMLFEDLVVAIDTPKLKFLRLCDSRTASFTLNNPASLVEVDINIDFNLCFEFGKKFDSNDLIKRKAIQSFLVGISRVKDMKITTKNLDIIYDFSKCERLPLFSNLSYLTIVSTNCIGWDVLSIFLESCPNLKYLVLAHCNYFQAYNNYPEEGADITSEPRCFLSSLEYIKIERPFKGEEIEMKLVSYFLKNSSILKKLTLYLDQSIKNDHSVIFKELLSIPRLSSSCQVVVS